ncbi:OmpA family protein [Mycobacterium sp.]|uniref:OmpA family protein n=1 Tax=Mycobacterium sp. TaxID=1785 RepID=UPI002CB2938B|nr:OmpA family protein [Mycobacterium sp.]HTH84208.1 OmpA family protein [Mycobacterium sp.]
MSAARTDMRKALVPLVRLVLGLLLPAVAIAQPSPGKDDPPKSGTQKVITTPSLGQAVEKQLDPDAPLTPWKLDENTLPPLVKERTESKEVIEKNVRTIKVQNLLPPIYFESGKADISNEYLEKVRKILEGMKDRRNVRLHLVGHTDNVPLFGETRIRYVDNAGLSRERAGVSAEFFQKTLGLPPESVTYEGRGEREPVASNTSEAGRARNRRMEVEVWYDEIDEKPVIKQMVVQENVQRVMVCRIEQMCKISYKEGHAKRTRVRNLIPPFHYEEGSTSVPQDYQQKLAQVLNDLGDKRNVVIKFIGYTDRTPLTGRDERIYANHVGVSKARARRLALALQDTLKLPAAAIDSDGKGAANPVASNDTESGRAANRRVEVEFWYDDALKELSPEPQMCPAPAEPETVTRVYQSPNISIKPVVYENGKPSLPPNYAQDLATVMAEIKDRKRVRLRFVGTTSTERLDRRTALAYGDDIGLSAARARTVMDSVARELGLAPEQVEHEGHGYLQTTDVVNNGFVEAEVSRVQAQVVYDDLAPIDNLEGLDVTRLTRDVNVANPYALNLMRITVDGKPLDDPGKSMPDVQRCTDVALEKARIQFKYDNLDLKPRLNVTAWPGSIRYQDDPATDLIDDQVRFKAYSNFAAFIANAEVRIFDKDKSVRDEPLAVVPVDKDGNAQWRADLPSYPAPGRDLKYVLRVYDKDGNFNETAAQNLWIIDRLAPDIAEKDAERELLVGYGESRLAIENIPLNGGTIKVYGADIPSGHRVSVAGRTVPVIDDRKFVVEEILPQGMHTVEVSVLDADGNGQMYMRDLSLEKTDRFYVAIADVTAAKSSTSGPAKLVAPDNWRYDNNKSVDGRFAFFARIKFGDQWKLTASADTLEGPFDSLFSNFMQKTPDAMFRRINPDYYYPTYGDDSTTEEAAPTLGKFYAKLQNRAHYGLWGNFRIGYTDNSLAHVDRTLYGANLHYEPSTTTRFGEKRLVLDGFAAQPGTLAGRDEFRGTGGSLYYLRHQDIMTGSERVRIEFRDKTSGLVVAVKNLVPVQDYTIDYLQGRILLNSPLSPVASDNLLVVSDVSPGNEAHLVVRYEYSTGFAELDNVSTGGRVHYWLNDNLKLGATANRNTDPGAESKLGAADITWRHSATTWLKVETGASTGTGAGAFGSNDGGFNFTPTTAANAPVPPVVDDARRGANRIDGSLDLNDVHTGTNGQVTFYRQQVEGGYAAPGTTTLTDVNRQGASVKTAITDKLDVRAKADKRSQDLSLDTSAVEVDAEYRLDDHWKLSSGVRKDRRIDNSPVVPLTQVQGDRTDVVARVTYDSQSNWAAYGYVQDTASTSGNREQNGRIGAGGAYRFNDRLKMSGELSDGDLGLGARLGTEYLVSEKTATYLNYALENERTDYGVLANKGSVIGGMKSQYSDTISIFGEERYTHGDVPVGLMHSAGIEYRPSQRWNFGTHVDVGTLRDNLTGAEMDRSGFAVSVGYGFEAIKVATLLEYRRDQVQSSIDLSYSNRKSLLTKNSLAYQINPEWRLIGKLNYAQSKSSLGEFYDGSYKEAVLGYGYRPVNNDRLNALAKYTYFYNLPSSSQELVPNTAASYIQSSHIVSLDAIYDLTPRWSVGGKYARRMGQVSQDRVNPVFFDSTADLYIARVDWHMLYQWDLAIEGRVLSVQQASDSRSGALVALYRNLSTHIKLGAGWNFTDFSDDLTNLSFTHRGAFINMVAKF